MQIRKTLSQELLSEPCVAVYCSRISEAGLCLIAFDLSTLDEDLMSTHIEIVRCVRQCGSKAHWMKTHPATNTIGVGFDWSSSVTAVIDGLVLSGGVQFNIGCLADATKA